MDENPPKVGDQAETENTPEPNLPTEANTSSLNPAEPIVHPVDQVGEEEYVEIIPEDVNQAGKEVKVEIISEDVTGHGSSSGIPRLAFSNSNLEMLRKNLELTLPPCPRAERTLEKEEIVDSLFIKDVNPVAEAVAKAMAEINAEKTSKAEAIARRERSGPRAGTSKSFQEGTLEDQVVARALAHSGKKTSRPGKMTSKGGVGVGDLKKFVEVIDISSDAERSADTSAASLLNPQLRIRSVQSQLQPTRLDRPVIPTPGTAFRVMSVNACYAIRDLFRSAGVRLGRPDFAPVHATEPQNVARVPFQRPEKPSRPMSRQRAHPLERHEHDSDYESSVSGHRRVEQHPPEAEPPPPQEPLRFLRHAGLSWGFTYKQWIFVVLLGFADFLSGMILSFQAPLFTNEASKKGLSSTETGVVFGAYEASFFYSFLFFWAKKDVFRPKRIFVCGIFIASLTCVLFGVLDRLATPSIFFMLSILLRTVGAVGSAAYAVSSFVIIAREFPGCVATPYITLQSYYGFGIVFGPIIGESLTQMKFLGIGGYRIPFEIVGSFLFLLSLLSMYFMPIVELDQVPFPHFQQRFGMKRLLKNSNAQIICASIFVTSMSIGHINVTLEPNLTQYYKLIPIAMGLMFTIISAFYALMASSIARACDRWNSSTSYNAFGLISIGLGIFVIGPVQGSENWLIYVLVGGIAFYGLGICLTLVSGYLALLREAKTIGFQDDIRTYGVVTSIWYLVSCAGSFLGAVVSGLVADNFPGYAFLIPLCSTFALSLCTLVFVCYTKWDIKNQEVPIAELQPLLPHASASNANQDVAGRSLGALGRLNPFDHPANLGRERHRSSYHSLP